jgi:hypothetical protein
MLCVSCTESDDTSAMAENISSGTGGDLVLAGMAPLPGAQGMPIDVAVETASVDLEFCKVDVKPIDNSAETTSGYCVNLFDDSGKMMGAFEIGETGSMAITCSSKVTSYKPMLNFSGENIDGEKLDRFMVYPKNMKPGDIYMTNDPWIASGHLNDFLLMMPVFHAGRVVGFTACTSHLVDLGGLGMGPDGSDVYDEGLVLPPLLPFSRLFWDICRVAAAISARLEPPPESESTGWLREVVFPKGAGLICVPPPGVMV